MYLATAAWRSRRSERGRVAYATSRMRMCLNTYSTSPRTLLDGTRRMKSRTSSAASASSSSRCPPSATRTPRQKVRPITDASKRAARALPGSASRRAAIAALTVVGRSWPNSCPSVSAEVSSSMNRGFPPDASASRSIASFKPAELARSRSARTNESRLDNGSSPIVV